MCTDESCVGVFEIGIDQYPNVDEPLVWPITARRGTNFLSETALRRLIGIDQSQSVEEPFLGASPKLSTTPWRVTARSFIERKWIIQVQYDWASAVLVMIGFQF